MAREGVTPEVAKAAVRRSNTLIAALMLRRGEADAMICGLVGRYDAAPGPCAPRHRPRPGVRTMAAMNALMLPSTRCSSPTPSSTRSPAPKNWPTSR
jgi:malate dehydrogenase (oxaloacetate-decarboxylating)(NADP+)